MPAKVSLEELIHTKNTVEKNNGNFTLAAQELGIPRTTLRDRYTTALLRTLQSNMNNIKPNEEQSEKTEVKESDNSITIEYIGSAIHTPEQLIANSNIDLNIWEVAEVNINNWEVGGKISQTTQSEDGTKTRSEPKLWKMPLRQIKVKLRRKSDERLAIESLIQIVSDNSRHIPKIKRQRQPKSIKERRRSLEVSIMDPHYGLQCFKPSSDMQWSLEECEDLCMWAIEDLIAKAKHHGPYEEIIFPFGNDYMHHDGMHHETTKGTPQPEGVAWSYIYERAEILAINMVERLKKEANVKVISIPGNHDHHSAYTLARVLNAYYRNDKNVIVDADSSPYKFHRYGVNLIGFEHGHHISSTRLPALMANERPKDWAQTVYREWHLGDQHRKGSGKPSTMEEQGVSVEYLPALTPPNQWHRLKGFNWQKRGAMAFVWDYNTGPEARLQSNIDTYTGLPATNK